MAYWVCKQCGAHNTGLAKEGCWDCEYGVDPPRVALERQKDRLLCGVLEMITLHGAGVDLTLEQLRALIDALVAMVKAELAYDKCQRFEE